MALVTVNAFRSDGGLVGSSNFRLNSEGRLPVAALKDRFNAQRGFILDDANGKYLVADPQSGYSVRTFAPGPIRVFLGPAARGRGVRPDDELHAAAVFRPE